MRAISPRLAGRRMEMAPSRFERLAILSVHTCPLALLGGKKSGGMNVYVRDLSRALSRRGILVDVFTRSQDDCQPRIRHDLGDGGRVIHVPAGPERPIPLEEVEATIPDFTAGVLKFTTGEGIRYDGLYSHYWLSGLVAEGLRQAWGSDIPLVQMFHTLGHMKNRVALTEAERAPQSRLEGEAHVMAIADRIVVSTPAEQAQLQWLYGADLTKTVIIPPGVDLERFHPISKRLAKERLGIPQKHQNILFAGRIEPLKGIDTLLRAIALLQERYPAIIENVCVAIIGGDPWNDNPDLEMERLQEMRQQLDLGDLVTFLGSKDQDSLPDYYAAAEMVVMPSDYESFGLVALEAMAMGRPVIASEVGGLAFLVQDGQTGFLVPARDPEALAQRIFQLLTDQGCRQLMGQQAAYYAKQYDWSIVANHIEALFRSLVGQYQPG